MSRRTSGSRAESSGGSDAEAALPVDDLGQLRERGHVVVAAGGREAPAEDRVVAPVAVEEGRVVVDGEAPKVEHGRVPERLGHLPVGPHCGQDRDPALLVGRAVAPAGQHEADGQSLEVPLPRAHGRLVEVVDVEHDQAGGRAVEPEVEAVRVPAQLGRDAAPGRGHQVERHHVRGAPVVGERRGGHARHPDRHQLRFTVGVRAQQLFDRVDAVRGRAPRAVAAAGRHFAQGSPGVAAIGPRPLAGPLPCGLVCGDRWVERALGAVHACHRRGSYREAVHPPDDPATAYRCAAATSVQNRS